MAEARIIHGDALALKSPYPWFGGKARVAADGRREDVTPAETRNAWVKSGRKEKS